ncbi:MAG: response regulator [Anaerolinea sp.]|nr:response regulator [Anaerolinea sp.]MCC6975220.1 response regulator [Anaerolineae bacterium]CAG0953974.1 Response regulator rcp1 [Anaerolineae bacterium]
MKHNKTILLVEDNPDDEVLTLRALRRHHVANEIVVTRDGAEALDYLLGTGTYAARDVTQIPQLILLDLKLPKVDGLEVLRRLRQNLYVRNVPVVVMTTSDEEQDRIQSYDLHANSFIRKPVDFNEFVEVIRQIGLYWLMLNEPPGGGD